MWYFIQIQTRIHTRTQIGIWIIEIWIKSILLVVIVGLLSIWIQILVFLVFLINIKNKILFLYSNMYHLNNIIVATAGLIAS